MILFVSGQNDVQAPINKKSGKKQNDLHIDPCPSQ
jgi:hypothetical protein